MADGDGSAAARDGSGSNVVEELTVKLEDGSERKVKADDVLNLIKQGAEATQKTQQVATVLAACSKYDITPDRLVDQASAAFDVIHTLQQEGTIDEQGNIVKKAAQAPNNQGDQDDNLFSAANPNQKTNADNVDAAIQKALGGLATTVDEIKTNQDYLARVHLEGEIKKANPDFSESDVVRTLAMAKAQKIPVSEATVIVAKERVVNIKAQREFHAKEFGIDLEEFDKNKLNQQDADGGAGPSYEGKRFSFKGGKDTVDPKDAMRGHFAANSGKQ